MLIILLNRSHGQASEHLSKIGRHIVRFSKNSPNNTGLRSINV